MITHIVKHSNDFPGPISIDAMLYRQSNGDLGFKPLVEINPRQTMSRIALAFKRHLAPLALGNFYVGHQRTGTASQFESMNRFQNAVNNRHPPELEHRRLKSGVFWLTAPDACAWACIATANTETGMEEIRKTLYERPKNMDLEQ